MQLKNGDGVALLDSLMAMVLLTAGVLGVLWTHQQTLLLQRQLVWRDNAMRLADNMAQRMLTHTSPAYARDWGMQNATAVQSCRATACNDTEWVGWQIQQANDELKQLPQGDMAITALPGLSNGWAVTVAWQDATETFRTDRAWGAPACPAEKSCWRLMFRTH